MAAGYYRFLGRELRVVRRTRRRRALSEAAVGGPNARRPSFALPRRPGVAARLLHPRRLFPGIARALRPAQRLAGRIAERLPVDDAEPPGVAEPPPACDIHRRVAGWVSRQQVTMGV